VRVLIPRGGFSALDIEGGPFWDPAADDAFVSAMRCGLRADIRVEEVADHINSDRFAEAAADALLSISRSVFRLQTREVPSQ
jgi:uncharacterized protein (UPF0261 family)